jgi:hypothetical protein
VPRTAPADLADPTAANGAGTAGPWSPIDARRVHES